MSHSLLFLLYLPITAFLPALLCWYVGRNAIGPFAGSKRVAYAAIACMLPLGLLAMLALTFWSEQDRSPIRALVHWGFSALGYLLLAGAALFLRDCLRLVWWLARKRIRSTAGMRRLDVGAQWVVYASSWVLLVAAGFAFWFGRRGADAMPHVRPVAVPIRALPESFVGYRVVQLSDVHLHGSVDRDRLRHLVERVNRLDADLIAITGDVVDGPMDDLRAILAPLGALRARDGVYVALGNHENYAGADACASEFELLGFHVLLNEHRTVQRGPDRIVVAGVPNPRQGMHGGRFTPIRGRVANMDSDPRLAVTHAPADTPRILLAHQPKSIAAARGLGFDLALAGHTHGGQFIPWNWGADWVFPYASGLQTDGPMQVYVSHGIGTFGPPLRLGSPAEIPVFELRRAN